MIAGIFKCKLKSGQMPLFDTNLLIPIISGKARLKNSKPTSNELGLWEKIKRIIIT